MSEKNGKIDQNSLVNRSTFNLNHTLNTTGRLGAVTPTVMNFMLPGDTIRNATDAYVEMKPTVTKLNSVVASNIENYFVPIEKTWKYWDTFISKTDEVLENGAKSVPELQRSQKLTTKYMPSLCVNDIFGYFLASLGTGIEDHNVSNYLLQNSSEDEGNVCDWTFNSREISYGSLSTFPASVTKRFGWWIPRIIGSGWRENSTFNLTCASIGSSNVVVNHQYGFLFCSDPELVALMNYFGRRSFESWADSTCYFIVYGVDDTNGYTYFKVYPSNSMWDIVGAGLMNVLSALTASWTVRVKNTGEDYGKIEVSSETGNDLYNPFPAFLEYIMVVNTFFCNPMMFGPGSLMEAMGCPMFRRINYNDPNVGLSSAIPAAAGTDPFYGWYPNYGPHISNNYISALPFFAYQQIISHRFLLPHEVLSNSFAQDATGSDISDKKYDSPIFRNVLVPDMCYEGDDTYLSDIFKGCTLNNGDLVDGTVAASVPVSRKIYSIRLNQMLTILLDRACLIDTPWTRFWQKENMMVSDALNASGIEITNSDDELRAKQLLLAHRTAKMIKFGGQDQSVEAFIANHYGVNNPRPDVCDIQRLSTDRQLIIAEDVINVGGAIDPAGDAMALGAKTSIASTTKANRGYFEYYAKCYGFYLQLHYMTVQNDFFDAKTPELFHLASNDVSSQGRRENFTAAYLPEFADTGDDVLYDTDIDQTGSPERIGYVDKNYYLKTTPNKVKGEFASLFRNQICSPVDPLFNDRQVALTYEYLQKPHTMYRNVFQDLRGDQFLLSLAQHEYRKSTQSKLNTVGMDI